VIRDESTWEKDGRSGKGLVLEPEERGADLKSAEVWAPKRLGVASVHLSCHN
jgi:hypothetical protein